jgi:glycosyltransferase involved in cell wall biosynthesis
MRIIGLITENDGAAYHRVFLPLMLLPGVDCHLTNKITEEQLEKGCDILYINRLAPYDTLEQIQEWKKKYGFKLIVDIDDFWFLDAHHIFFDIWKEDKITDKILSFIESADWVTCTHGRLYTAIKEINNKVAILPNAIPQEGQFNITRTQSDKVRLFWAGSITHQKDVEILRGPMQRLTELTNKVTPVLGGYTHSDVWSAIVAAYTNGLKLKPILHKGTSPANYYSIYQDCDIALIPLLETSFNRYKSNLKVLEAANVGAAVVVSNVHPYKFFPDNLVSYVNTQKDWYIHIKTLVNNKSYREEQGLKLQEYCRTNYDFQHINKERLELCNSLM